MSTFFNVRERNVGALNIFLKQKCLEKAKCLGDIKRDGNVCAMEIYGEYKQILKLTLSISCHNCIGVFLAALSDLYQVYLTPQSLSECVPLQNLDTNNKE